MNIYAALGAAALISFLAAFGLGYVVIPLLHKLNFGQTILDIGPKWHKSKEGTPTMGGFMFIIGTVAAIAAVFIIDKILGGDIIAGDVVTVNAQRVKIWGGLIMALGFSAIGFADDYVKVVKKRNLGLNIRQKTLLQLLVIFGYLASLYAVGANYMYVPFIGSVEMGGILFFLLGVFVIYCTVNAVNFTDGVDGLCGSVTLTAAVSFAIIAFLRDNLGVSLLTSALAGACGGYLIWNKYPAKVMMGDTGSMFLGGMIVAAAYALNRPLLILPLGIIYVAEFGSDIIQIVYFRATHGKRIFKMAPIHHHFELCGWNEKKVVAVFTAVNIIGCHHHHQKLGQYQLPFQ